jgi:hypothetical protein
MAYSDAYGQLYNVQTLIDHGGQKVRKTGRGTHF